MDSNGSGVGGDGGGRNNHQQHLRRRNNSYASLGKHPQHRPLLLLYKRSLFAQILIVGGGIYYVFISFGLYLHATNNDGSHDSASILPRVIRGNDKLHIFPSSSSSSSSSSNQREDKITLHTIKATFMNGGGSNKRTASSSIASNKKYRRNNNNTNNKKNGTITTTTTTTNKEDYLKGQLLLHATSISQQRARNYQQTHQRKENSTTTTATTEATTTTTTTTRATTKKLLPAESSSLLLSSSNHTTTLKTTPTTTRMKTASSQTRLTSNSTNNNNNNTTSSSSNAAAVAGVVDWTFLNDYAKSKLIEDRYYNYIPSWRRRKKKKRYITRRRHYSNRDSNSNNDIANAALNSEIMLDDDYYYDDNGEDELSVLRRHPLRIPGYIAGQATNNFTYFGYVMRDFAHRVLSRRVVSAGSNVLVLYSPHDDDNDIDENDYSSVGSTMEPSDHQMSLEELRNYHSVGQSFVRHSLQEGHDVHVPRILHSTSSKLHTIDDWWSTFDHHDDASNNNGRSHSTTPPPTTTTVVRNRPEWILLGVFDDLNNVDVAFNQSNRFLHECTMTYAILKVSSVITNGGDYIAYSESKATFVDYGITAVDKLIEHGYKVQILSASHGKSAIFDARKYEPNRLFKTTNGVKEYLHRGAWVANILRKEAEKGANTNVSNSSSSSSSSGSNVPFVSYLFATQGLDLAIPSRMTYMKPTPYDTKDYDSYWLDTSLRNVIQTRYKECTQNQIIGPDKTPRLEFRNTKETTDHGIFCDNYIFRKQMYHSTHSHSSTTPTRVNTCFARHLMNVTFDGQSIHPDDITRIWMHDKSNENSGTATSSLSPSVSTAEAACVEFYEPLMKVAVDYDEIAKNPKLSPPSRQQQPGTGGGGGVQEPERNRVVACTTRIVRKEQGNDIAASDTPDTATLASTTDKKQPNLLVIMIDPVSRPVFYQNLPKTKQLLERMEFVHFTNYTVVGDNSGPNQAALYSGQQLLERQQIASLQKDNNWLWDDLREKGGYATFKAEDGCISNSNMIQSIKPKTHHGT